MERFWSKVEKTDGCWEWQASTRRDGYGQFNKGPRGAGTAAAHRMAFELTHGPIPSGVQVNHHCDNKICCNPEHLYLGTQKDNIQDAVRRGRHTFEKHDGEDNGNAVLTEEQVLEIRSRDGQTQLSIAKEFGVSKYAVHCVLTRKTWSHI